MEQQDLKLAPVGQFSSVLSAWGGSLDPASAGSHEAGIADLQSRQAGHFMKSPHIVALLEGAYKDNNYPLKNKQTKERLVQESGLTSGQLQVGERLQEQG
jgi:hypothetical protein